MINTQECESEVKYLRKNFGITLFLPIFDFHTKLNKTMSKNCIGKNNHFYGKRHSEETKRRLSATHKGKVHSEETKNKMSLKHIGIKKTKEDKDGCRKRMLNYIKEGKIKIARGEEHWNWKGGISSFNRKLRTHSKWKIWRELVFLRDNFTCQNPNCFYCHNKIGVFLHPHHIKPLALYPNLTFNINNGITYCAEFHLNSKELHKGIVNNKTCESRR